MIDRSSAHTFVLCERSVAIALTRSFLIVTGTLVTFRLIGSHQAHVAIFSSIALLQVLIWRRRAARNHITHGAQYMSSQLAFLGAIASLVVVTTDVALAFPLALACILLTYHTITTFGDHHQQVRIGLLWCIHETAIYIVARIATIS